MPDIFDRIKLDVFDTTELPIEEKVIYFPEMQKAIDDAVREKIKDLSLEKIIYDAVDSEVRKQKERLENDYAKKQRTDESFKRTLTETMNKAKADLEEKMAKKYDALINKLNYQEPRYQFGGYPPPGGGLPIPGEGGLMEWRIIIVGTDLQVQKLESGTWVEKASFQP